MSLLMRSAKKLLRPNYSKHFLRCQSSLASITKATPDVNNKSLTLTWDDGSTTKYPYLWLQDNCQNEKNFHPVSKSRLQLVRDLSPELLIKDVKIYDSTQKILIEWQNGEVSPFLFDWLWDRKFQNDKKQSMGDCWAKKKPVYWGSDLKLQQFDFKKLLINDNHLYNWLTTMEEEGITVVKNTPLEVKQINKIIHRVAHPRETNYGVNFTVKSKRDPSNVAYTANTLGLHTDLPYFKYIPGIQLLHCIKQTETLGGENEFADGFSVAEQMRKNYPEEFKVLTEVPVNFIDVGVDSYSFFMRAQHTTIGLDMFGDIERIAYNNMTRDSYLTSDIDNVDKFYEALILFDKLLYSEKNIYNIKLDEGDTIIFDNHRTLHGRKGYQITNKTSRQLDGAYIDWDEMLSRRRRLQMEQGSKY